MVGDQDAASLQKENQEASSSEISASSEATQSESSPEPAKPYVTPGKAELSPAEQKLLMRAKIAQVAKEMAEAEALAKKKAEREERKAAKAKRKAERAQKREEEDIKITKVWSKDPRASHKNTYDQTLRLEERRISGCF